RAPDRGRNRAKMLRSRKLAVGGVAAASALAVFGIAALPSASAANCTVTVKLLGGTLTTLSVPQGVSPSTLSLPAGAVLVSETCPPQTTSTSTPGAAPVGVPNFFIDSFQIPPFLLPIYQAAGIEYDVPWQVLAAINEIETDYGRNLSVSSAGAVGWMQFLPSTWKQWAVAATGN